MIELLSLSTDESTGENTTHAPQSKSNSEEEGNIRQIVEYAAYSVLELVKNGNIRMGSLLGENIMPEDEVFVSCRLHLAFFWPNFCLYPLHFVSVDIIDKYLP